MNSKATGGSGVPSKLIRAVWDFFFCFSFYPFCPCPTAATNHGRGCAAPTFSRLRSGSREVSSPLGFYGV